MSIPALLSRIVFVNLQKRLSISVPCLSENLVGSVIWGYILCDVRRSKKSLVSSSSFNFSRFVIITGKDYIVLYLV